MRPPRRWRSGTSSSSAGGCGAIPTVGVTGTNGKSTTARLLAAILGQPGPPAGNFEFGPALCAAPRDGSLVAEVSSFQLEAAPSVLPHVAVLTNLTDEHLGWHGSRGAYADAKRRLFVREDGRTAGTSVLNLDDPFGRELAREVAAAGGAVVTYGERDGADVRIAGARWSAAGATVVLARAAGELTLTTALPGAHNARNVAAAVAAAGALGRPDAEVAAAVAATPRLPGRWERIEGGQPFDVLVDYAHTPDGVRAVLEAARALVDERPGARLRTVLGPVGLADPEKAAGIGRWASRLSDDVMLTSGSAPGSERIPRLAELRRACDGGARVTLRLDRRAAIAEAVGAARDGRRRRRARPRRARPPAARPPRHAGAARRPRGGARGPACARMGPMDVVIATPALAGPGGAQSYALTAGEHLARLGHHVTLYARELGHVAGQAVEAGLAVAGSEAALPDRADAVIGGVSQALALELAERYPAATRLWVVHGDNHQLPPAVPGVVAASVALNDRTRARRGRGAERRRGGAPAPARRPAPLQPAGRAGARAANGAAVRQLRRAPGGAGERAARRVGRRGAGVAHGGVARPGARPGRRHRRGGHRRRHRALRAGGDGLRAARVRARPRGLRRLADARALRDDRGRRLRRLAGTAAARARRAARGPRRLRPGARPGGPGPRAPAPRRARPRRRAGRARSSASRPSRSPWTARRAAR